MWQILKAHYDDSQEYQEHTGGTVQGFGGCLVCEHRGNPGPQEGKNNAQEEYTPVRRTTDGKMGSSTGKRRKGHDEHTGSYGSFQLIPQDTCENQQHHHSAARSYKAADKTNHAAADQRLHRPFPGGNALHGLFGGHNRPDNEFHTQQEGHKHGKAAHGSGGNETGNVASHNGKGQHTDHHNQAVSYIQVFVLSIGVGRHRTGQNIGGKGDAYRHIGLHVKKCNQHGTDDRGGTESGKAGAQARAHSREKGYKNCDQ